MNQLSNILPSWDDAVNNLKARANEFQRNYDLMVSVEPALRKDNALYSEYINTKKAADIARSSVQAIASLIDSGYRWFNGAGLSGANMGLAFPIVPAVGVAAVVSAAATLSYISPKMYDIYIRGELVKSGAAKADDLFKPDDALPWIVAGIGVYLLLPYLTKGKK